MRLVYILEVDFRKSEATNFKDNLADFPHMGPDDVVLFLSRGGDQLCFVSDFVPVENGKVADRKIIRSTKLRLTGGRWNPLMLVNYAEQVGLKLDSLKKFEQYYKKLVK